MDPQSWPSPHPKEYTGGPELREVSAMIRSISIALAFVAGSATAGEAMDCFNDETDADVRYTSAEPEALRVTDADIDEMLRRIRENESRAVADRDGESDPALRVSLAGSAPDSD